jgi:succinyl-diaminopimelate desuccinylase
MIIGTDEESQWRCVEHYFKHEEMPTMGFAPDADFPIIHAEKGISDFDFAQITQPLVEGEDQVKVKSFVSGQRYNMVPDFAKAIVEVKREQTEIVQRYRTFLTQKMLTGKCYVDNGDLVLELMGVSAHGMEPRNGVNAGLWLATFLAQLELDSRSNTFFQFVETYFTKESRGKMLGIQYSDEVSGDLTINIGKLSFSQEVGGRIGVNLRYPVTANFQETKNKLEELCQKEGFSLENFTNSPPHYVSEDNVLIQTLKKVYEEQTGEKAELLAIGGGTYARSLQSGVAFGPLFPGREDIAHQKDEYIIIDDLLKATAIYAQAIYELTRKGE